MEPNCIHIEPGTRVDVSTKGDGCTLPLEEEVELTLGSVTLVFSDSATLLRLAQQADKARDILKMKPRPPMCGF